MGKRGPTPKPSKLKLLEGNPGKRALPKDEPQPDADTAMLKAPSYLSSQAQHEWRRVAPQLYELGLLTQIDGAALEAYCEAYATWRETMKVLRSQGRTYETDTGYIRARPEVGMANEALRQLKAFAAEFGLTPSSRGRLSLPEVQGEDPFDSYLKRGSGGG
jgi:P27 family predicted phage terminase small subunit